MPDHVKFVTRGDPFKIESLRTMFHKRSLQKHAAQLINTGESL